MHSIILPPAIESAPASLDEWSDALEEDTTYLAESAGFIVGYLYHGPSSRMQVVTDADNPPTVIRINVEVETGYGEIVQFTCPVRRGDRWRVNRLIGNAVCTFYWIPYTGSFGAWQNREKNTIYQATSDGFVVGIAEHGTQTSTINIIEGADTPPDVYLLQGRVVADLSCDIAFCLPVRKDYYWTAIRDGGDAAVSLSWIPIG